MGAFVIIVVRCIACRFVDSDVKCVWCIIYITGVDGYDVHWVTNSIWGQLSREIWHISIV